MSWDDSVSVELLLLVLLCQLYLFRLYSFVWSIAFCFTFVDGRDMSSVEVMFVVVMRSVCNFDGRIFCMMVPCAVEERARVQHAYPYPY